MLFLLTGEKVRGILTREVENELILICNIRSIFVDKLYNKLECSFKCKC